MSTTAPVTLSSLKFIRPPALAEVLRTPATASRVAIIDVRDNDHIGGHIKSSHWIPIQQFDAKLPEMLRTLKGKDQVVFHCMLSQQRGPKAALRYARAKAYEEEKRRNEETPVQTGDGQEQSSNDTPTDSAGLFGGQEICVLEGGFDNWQRFYGEDLDLTQNYQKDLW